jgi:exopolyphosphatase/guanosine-5'-triphosphate,3'-diphosphate pyrophosphatase
MLRVGCCGRGEREFLFCYRQLNQDRASAIVRMRTHVYPKRVLLELVPGRGGAELEAWSLRKEADYFREVFRRDLAVDVA